jgi:hypothetical protein
LMVSLSNKISFDQRGATGCYGAFSGVPHSVL